MALLVGAWVSGPVGSLFFGSLLYRRIGAEEHAMGVYRPFPSRS
jgi:isoprenylcysteine carboxyl methyltransferase (ICMT) family protein YpbQ